MERRFRIERFAAPHQISAVQKGRRCTEQKAPLEQMHSACFCPGYALNRPFDAAATYSSARQVVRADDQSGGMRFRDSDHPLQALREDAVIRLNHLYISRIRIDMPERAVVVRDLTDELWVADDTNAFVFRRVLGG